jgi:hypothetical protein
MDKEMKSCGHNGSNQSMKPIETTTGKAKKRALPLRRVAAGIASIRRWTDGQCFWQKSKAANHE